MTMTVTLTPGREPTHVARDPLTPELSRVLARINRELRYRTRAARASLDITHSESELLRLVNRRPGLRVHEAAVELGIASNSVSTLVRALSRAGLLERLTDPLDGRAACLHLTPQATEWLTQVGNAREEVIDRALASLAVDDRAALADLLPTLSRFAAAMSRTENANL